MLWVCRTSHTAGACASGPRSQPLFSELGHYGSVGGLVDRVLAAAFPRVWPSALVGWAESHFDGIAKWEKEKELRIHTHIANSIHAPHSMGGVSRYFTL